MRRGRNTQEKGKAGIHLWKGKHRRTEGPILWITWAHEMRIILAGSVDPAISDHRNWLEKDWKVIGRWHIWMTCVILLQMIFPNYFCVPPHYFFICYSSFSSYAPFCTLCDFPIYLKLNLQEISLYCCKNDWRNNIVLQLSWVISL